MRVETVQTLLLKENEYEVLRKATDLLWEFYNNKEVREYFNEHLCGFLGIYDIAEKVMEIFDMVEKE